MTLTNKLNFKTLLFCFVFLSIFPINAMVTPNGTLTDLISNKPLPTMGIIAAHPGRIERIAHEFLEDVDLHSEIRGYKVYTGTYNGQRVFATYTAMGGPSVSMIVENLIVAGAKKIVRIGTSDNDNEEQDLSTLRVLTETMGLHGMMFDYGFSPEEIGTPLPSSPSLTASILLAAQKINIAHVKLAKAYNIDAYHVFSNSSRFAKNEQVIRDRIQFYKDQGATIRDMESGTLFMLGQLRGIDTAAVLISQIKHNKETEEHKKIMLDREADAIRIVLHALTDSE